MTEKEPKKERHMTPEEAIKWLRQINNKYIHGGDEEFDSKRKEAIFYAISIIEKEEQRREGRDTCEFCKHKFRLETERPCSLCKHNFKNQFERKDTGEEE